MIALLQFYAIVFQCAFKTIIGGCDFAATVQVFRIMYTNKSNSVIRKSNFINGHN